MLSLEQLQRKERQLELEKARAKTSNLLEANKKAAAEILKSALISLQGTSSTSNVRSVIR